MSSPTNVNLNIFLKHSNFDDKIVSFILSVIQGENRHYETETIMKTPLDAANLSPEEMLEMLRFQAEIGVDECLLDEPASVLTSETASEPPQMMKSASEEAVLATLSPEKIITKATSTLNVKRAAMARCC